MAEAIDRPTMLVQDDIRELRERASDYVEENLDGYSGRYAKCCWFYRNKDPEYFEDIRNSDGGIMKTIRKDNSGDPGSPINGNISGLFFSANVKYNSTSGEPIPFSPFGPRRLLVPALHLLEKAPNIYFADFYCMPTSAPGGPNHNVTLVMTTSGSKADKFCAKRLVQLDIQDNPFLFKDTSGMLQVTTAKKLYVEMYYTEHLDINPYLGSLTSCDTVCQGHSTPGGVPKIESCPICNIFKH